mmetsp:Transcript_6906/g.22090  ORF Transcript_6906/g.22090 Transcript_6906/m.22090 type:complete len:600 (-) Transcript_6906:241-2040(-)
MHQHTRTAKRPPSRCRARGSDRMHVVEDAPDRFDGCGRGEASDRQAPDRVRAARRRAVGHAEAVVGDILGDDLRVGSRRSDLAPRRTDGGGVAGVQGAAQRLRVRQGGREIASLARLEHVQHVEAGGGRDGAWDVGEAVGQRGDEVLHQADGRDRRRRQLRHALRVLRDVTVVHVAGEDGALAAVGPRVARADQLLQLPLRLREGVGAAVQAVEDREEDVGGPLARRAVQHAAEIRRARRDHLEQRLEARAREGDVAVVPHVGERLRAGEQDDVGRARAADLVQDPLQLLLGECLPRLEDREHLRPRHGDAARARRVGPRRRILAVLALPEGRIVQRPQRLLVLRLADVDVLRAPPRVHRDDLRRAEVRRAVADGGAAHGHVVEPRLEPVRLAGRPRDAVLLVVVVLGAVAPHVVGDLVVVPHLAHVHARRTHGEQPAVRQVLLVARVVVVRGGELVARREMRWVLIVAIAGRDVPCAHSVATMAVLVDEVANVRPSVELSGLEHACHLVVHSEVAVREVGAGRVRDLQRIELVGRARVSYLRRVGRAGDGEVVRIRAVEASGFGVDSVVAAGLNLGMARARRVAIVQASAALRALLGD